MRKFNTYITRLFCLTAAAVALLATSCTKDDVPDNREKEYGYVQFRLYKAASYSADEQTAQQSSRAVVTQLDYLSQASKIRVTIVVNGRSRQQTITQTLTLSASDSDAKAEWGLRSEKIQLLAGNYTVAAYTLYDAEDKELYYGQPIAGAESFDITAGGFTSHDLTANVKPRGHLNVRLIKDLSGFGGPSKLSANDRSHQYTLDEITAVTFTLRNTATNANITVGDLNNGGRLKVKFKLDFSDKEGEESKRVSYLTCDSLVSVEAGEYRLVNYTVFTGSRGTSMMETNTSPANCIFTVRDNETTDADIPVTLYESDEYIKDYYALYEIWKALDGENWYYNGDLYAKGVNWVFDDMDIDLWGAQPGVTLHTNGRVSGIDISDFGFRGEIPDAIGQLTEMVALYLGTHNDLNTYEYDPTRDMSKTLLERHLEFGRILHPRTQMSEPIARGLKEKNISIPEIALYDKYTEAQIIDKATGRPQTPQLKDIIPGKICNGLTRISPEIGKLTKLTYLFIANSTLEGLPDAFETMESLTDLEVYNCPKMTKFPVELAKLPNLVSANLASNPQWSAEEALKGFKAMATGASQDKIQILYYNGNNLEEVPEEIRNMLKIGLLDLSSNNISKVCAFGKTIAPVQLYLDDNKISELPVDEEGFFCGYADIETFSASNNLFTTLPNIFSAKSVFRMSSVDFSLNNITGVDLSHGEYKGINVETLTLSANKLKTFPKEIFTAGSTVFFINVRGNEMETIEEGWLDKDKNTQSLQSIDLSYNHLTKLPKDVSAQTLPYLYGIDLSYNRISSNDAYWPVLNCGSLNMIALRGQRDADGNRCLKDWPTGIYQHFALRALYLGSNDLRTVNDTISYLIYYLDISDNPNITFDASDICYYYQAGAYIFIYDKTQNILNCDIMLQ